MSSDRRESSHNSAVMRHPDGDKVVIAKNENGDWIYFSIRDGGDNGTVIDFIQNRTGENLGHVRKTLRAWSGSARPSVPEAAFVRDLFPITRDRAAVMAAWGQARACLSLPYLTSRGLGPEVLGLPLFAGCVRVDDRKQRPSSPIMTGRAFAASKSRTGILPALPLGASKGFGTAGASPRTSGLS